MAGSNYVDENVNLSGSFVIVIDKIGIVLVCVSKEVVVVRIVNFWLV